MCVLKENYNIPAIIKHKINVMKFILYYLLNPLYCHHFNEKTRFCTIDYARDILAFLTVTLSIIQIPQNVTIATNYSLSNTYLHNAILTMKLVHSTILTIILKIGSVFLPAF